MLTAGGEKEQAAQRTLKIFDCWHVLCAYVYVMLMSCRHTATISNLALLDLSHRILEYRVDFVTTSSGLNRIFSLVMPVFWCLIVLWFFYLFMMILRFEAKVTFRITKPQSIACHCWKLLISSLVFFSLNSIMLQLQQTRLHRSRLPGAKTCFNCGKNVLCPMHVPNNRRCFK